MKEELKQLQKLINDRDWNWCMQPDPIMGEGCYAIEPRESGKPYPQTVWIKEKDADPINCRGGFILWAARCAMKTGCVFILEPFDGQVRASIFMSNEDPDLCMTWVGLGTSEDHATVNLTISFLTKVTK